jgi:RHS repeat-associated protein
VAVLRGKASERSGDPLAGVRVTVVGHPEFGETTTRPDGNFYLAVNGGSQLIVRFEKAGFLPVERKLDVPWQDYEFSDDVVLVPLDQEAVIQPNDQTQMQTAQGSSITDSDGSRRATLLFPRGTSAEMVLPDGSTQPLTNPLEVRATEYTVGSTGDEAMPGELPPTSAYTYAAAFTVDDALAAGARRVNFSKDVVNYTDNFLSFPVGEQVPVGYYDPQKGAWAASEQGSGLVVKILDEAGGIASLDLDGSGDAATQEELDALGITDDERQKLSELYDAPKTLWRVPIRHFTPFDHNWPFGFPAGAIGPDGLPVSGASLQDANCEGSGSILECEDQVLGEELDVAGTPYTLNYRSDRTPGRKAAYEVEIPLSGGSVPASLKRIELELEVAGRRFEQSFPPDPNQSHTFRWDGQDAFGRTLQGSHPLSVRIGYTYDGVYGPGRGFGRPANGQRLTGSRTRREVTIWRDHKLSVGAWDARGQGLGGWTLDVHHAYDPIAHVLYEGDGTRRAAQGTQRTIETVAGGGTDQVGDGIPATDAFVFRAWEVEAAPDQGFYVVYGTGTGDLRTRVRKVASDGMIRTYAGGACPSPIPTGPDPANGQPALTAGFCDISGIDVGPDGSLYISDQTLSRVRRVRPDGTIEAIAGDGTRAFSGDGGQATAASLNEPTDLAVAPDGSVYIVDSRNGRIRKIGPDGLIETVAGDGTFCDFDQLKLNPPEDGDPATTQHACFIEDVEVGPDGGLYFAQSVHLRVRRIDTDGIVQTFAGCGTCSTQGDGGPATDARLEDVRSIDFAPDGSLYLAHTIANRIRKVDQAGTITTYAGKGAGNFSGDGGAAAAAELQAPESVAVARDGSVLIADTFNFRFRRVSPTLPGFSDSDLAIPSEDGSELYQFDASGRHLRTVNTLTGANLYTFSYNTGRLSTITDGDGNVTTIQRDEVTGEPIAIVPPFTHPPTMLDTDPNGFLSSVTDPAAKTTAFTYSADGLLDTLIDPKSGPKDYDYDALGRLRLVRDQANRAKTLDRTATTSSYETTLRTQLNRATSYKVERLATEGTRRTHTDPAGLASTLRIDQDGSRTATAADGITTTSQSGPDPRFRMNAPILKELTVTTPGSPSIPARTLSVQGARQVTLQDPGDPLTLDSQTDTLQVNSRTYTTDFDPVLDRFTTNSPMSRESQTDVDDQGRPTRQAVTGIDPLTSTYKPNGLLETQTQGNRSWTYTYEPSGFLDTITDPLGRLTSFDYDGAGRVTRQTLPGGREVLYRYDDNGNLRSVTPPGRTDHTFTHTPVDLLESYTAPPVTTDPTLPLTTTYDYDNDNALDRILRPGGTIVDFAYNTINGRLEKITQPRGDTDFSYDAQTGNLSSITAPGNERIDLEFDGSLPTRETVSGTVSGSVSRTYDDDLRLESSSVNGASTVSYSYDDDGLLTDADALTLSRDTQNGLLRGTTLGLTSTTLDYNQFGEPNTLDARFNTTTTLYSATYERDDLGRIERKTETTSQGTHVYDYSYDPAGRLDTVDRDGVRISDFEYDQNGNRTLEMTSGRVGIYDEQDRLSSYGATTYTYTAAGELRTKRLAADVTTYDYDALGSLENVTLPDGTAIDYITDGYGRRIAKKRNGDLVQGFLYGDEALGPVAELDAQGNLKSRFVYATRSNVPDYMIRNGVTYRIVSDHLGSPRMIVDISSGTVAQEMDYDEFGRVIRDTSPGFQPLGFAGGLYDSDTDLLRFGARDYDPETGRWTSKDPIGFAGGDTNLFAYVLNDPINLFDSSGLFSLPGGIDRAWDAVKDAGGSAWNGIKSAYDYASNHWREAAAITGGAVCIVGSAGACVAVVGAGLGLQTFSNLRQGLESGCWNRAAREQLANTGSSLLSLVPGARLIMPGVSRYLPKSRLGQYAIRTYLETPGTVLGVLLP